MRKTIYFIGIFLAMLACSKEEETYTFVESLEDKLLKAISDTTGLKVFGMGEAYGKTDTLSCLVGIKYDKMWCGFFSGNDSVGYKEEFIYVSNEKFKDTLKFEVGYGEVDTVIFSKNNDKYTTFIGYLFDNDKFAMSKMGYSGERPITIFINKTKISYQSLWVTNLWFDGYYIGISNSETNITPIYNLNGEYVGEQNSQYNNSIPVSLYECIQIGCADNISLTRTNTQTANTLWSYELTIGKVINNNAPRISYTRSLDGNILTLEASATNYDGTQETGFFQINIDTEEIIANDGFTINQAQ